MWATVRDRRSGRGARGPLRWQVGGSRTNTGLAATEVALKYKELWTVEALFRSAKSLLETRPVFHRCDEAIRGHVFCSFLALVLRKELQERLARHGDRFEWADILRDLEALTETEVTPRG